MTGGHRWPLRAVLLVLAAGVLAARAHGCVGSVSRDESAGHIAADAAAPAHELFHYGLPGPLYPPRLFPGLATLLEHWKEMRADALAVKTDMGLIRTARSFDGEVAAEFLRKVAEGGNSGWTTAWTEDQGWKNYGLVKENEGFGGVTEELCGFTVALLKSIPGMRLAGFSKLLPNARIETHVDNAGLSHNSVAVHVYLTGYARMRIGDQWIEHVPGNMLIFNGNVDHEVINGGEERIILYTELDLQEFFLRTEGVDLSLQRPQTY